jgi:tetratricopeptide (TPR) repeat protein
MSAMRQLLCAVIAAVLASGAFAQDAGAGRVEFDAGVAAYRAGDPAGALRAFERARQTGYDTPQLQFNLGLCYYKLRRYPEARAQFESLRGHEGYAGVADFHLALIAAREGDRDRARGLWRALEGGADGGLAQRASVALGRLEGGAPDPVSAGYLLVGAGYDTNPALLDESLQPAGGGESANTELFGALSLPLAGTARAHTALRLGAYLKDYGEDLGLDQRGAFAGLWRELDDGARRLSLGLDASTSEFDGERFLDVVTLLAQRAPSSGTGWRLGAQVSDIRAPGAYTNLDGWRARLSAARAWRARGALALLGYELELNERADRTDGNEFFSSSPRRHRFDAALEHPWGTRGSLRWTLRYRDSRYADPDVFLDGAVPREVRREEQLAQAGVQLRRRLGRETFALVEIQYGRNASTREPYDYDRGTGLLGLEWVPVGGRK